MTEQQIDAELSRYEPAPYLSGWAWHPRRGGIWGRYALPVRIHAALPQRRTGGYGIYPTRAAAFADLRQAIAAAGGNPCSCSG